MTSLTNRNIWAYFMRVVSAEGVWLRGGRRMLKIKRLAKADLTYSERREVGCKVALVGPLAFIYRVESIRKVI